MTTADQSRALALLIVSDPTTQYDIQQARSWDNCSDEIKQRAAELFEKAAGEPMDSFVEYVPPEGRQRIGRRRP